MGVIQLSNCIKEINKSSEYSNINDEHVKKIEPELIGVVVP